jgi:polyhydroxyalkanoate synthesis repressor PhaR
MGKNTTGKKNKKDTKKDDLVTIKKYANRRLYNTATSNYITLDYLCQMVKDGVEFVVYDAKTGEDITRPVLTQIIVEEENKGQNLMPIGFLRHLIGFYGDSLQEVVPKYLEFSMQNFTHNQDDMRKYLDNSFAGIFSLSRYEQLGRQNMELFDRALKMFTPFPGGGNKPSASDDNGGGDDTPSESEIRILKQQVEELRSRLEKISSTASGGKG